MVSPYDAASAHRKAVARAGIDRPLTTRRHTSPFDIGGAEILQAVARCLVQNGLLRPLRALRDAPHRGGEVTTLRLLALAIGRIVVAIEDHTLFAIGTACQHHQRKRDNRRAPQHARYGPVCCQIIHSAATALTRPARLALIRSSISSRKLRIRP